MEFKPEHHHQLAIDWLVSHPQAALWMGMGLGKTVSTLTAFNILHTLGDVRAMLVVSPLRVTNLTWPNEIEKWDHVKHHRVANLRTKQGWMDLLDGNADVYLINYESLPRLVEKYMVGRKGKYPFDLLVFDESTMAKNHKSTRINQFRRYIPHVKRRWGLTGTPNPNSLMEVFAQIRLLDEGARLGMSFDRYKRTYFHATDYMEYNWEINGPQAEQAIYKKLSDIALVLRQRDYADFSEPIIEDVSVPFPEEAKEMYDELAEELLLSMGDGEAPIIAPNAAALVNKLLQVTGGQVYREDQTVATIHNAKLIALQELITKLRKKDPERTFLIACNYKHEQVRLRDNITPSFMFADATTKTQQELLFQQWNQGKVSALIVDPRSVGHGLNLQSGGYTIIWYSLPWSGELYNQLNARLARRGQDRTVEVYRLICPQTMDDAVVETLRQKELGQKALFNALKNFRRLTQST